MGGPMSAFDEAGYPWLADEKNLIREVVAAGVPYFGVCLGAQLLAEALGGRTYHGPEPELGIHPVVLTEAGGVDPVFGGFPRHISVFEFHEDTSICHRAPYGSPGRRDSRTRDSGSDRSHTRSSAISRSRVRAAEVPRPVSVRRRRDRAAARAGLDRSLLERVQSTVPTIRETGRQLFVRWLENVVVWGGQVAVGRSLAGVGGADWSRGIAGRGGLRSHLESVLAAARGGRALSRARRRGRYRQVDPAGLRGRAGRRVGHGRGADLRVSCDRRRTVRGSHRTALSARRVGRARRRQPARRGRSARSVRCLQGCRGSNQRQ